MPVLKGTDGRPRIRCILDNEAGGTLTVGIWFGKVDVRRHLTVFQCQNSFDETRQAGRPFGVADIGFDLVQTNFDQSPTGPFGMHKGQFIPR